MALFTGISAANRVVEQGDTYEYDIEPAVTDTTVAVDQGEGSAKVYDKDTVVQWHGVLRYSKRYKYVGLTASAAATAAANIRAAYSVDVAKWAVGIFVSTSGGTSTSRYKYLNTGSVPMTCATVTPTKGDGPVWEVAVDVDATFEIYTDDDDEPSDSDMIALATGAGITNFPEST